MNEGKNGCERGKIQQGYLHLPGKTNHFACFVNVRSLQRNHRTVVRLSGGLQTRLEGMIPTSIFIRKHMQKVAYSTKRKAKDKR